jgi:divalent metal cation (Fe/Co/Zn/Cd) transporter
VVVHVEPISETTGLVERAQAAASRVDGVYEIHNVQIHAFHEGGERKLHVTLHAKAQPGVSLVEAHRLSDLIEDAVGAELGEEARVDSHIEPLKRTTLGRDVTSNRSDVVEAVRELALQEPDILDCHEVLVTSVDGQLAVVAHVHGRPTVALSRIHEAADRIEKSILIAHPDVESVTIHFEPAG